MTIAIEEGARRPLRDIDNYSKKLMDGITKTGLLWSDDEQVDELVVRRVKNYKQIGTKVTVRVERL